MSDVEQAVVGAPAQRGRRRFLNWKVLALAAVVVLAATGGGTYYFLGDLVFGHPPEKKAAKVEEAPLPYFVEVKPFVVSMVNESGAPHFVQIGVNFTMAGAAVANLLNALLPEVTDAMRQTALTFKVEDVVTPAGVDKMRQAMLIDINKVMLARLGAERIRNATGGDENTVRKLYFTTLIVE